jgi:hypothetical protein
MLTGIFNPVIPGLVFVADAILEVHVFYLVIRVIKFL